MSKHNCMEECYAKLRLKLAEREKEEAKRQKVQPCQCPEPIDPPEHQVAFIAAPNQPDAPQPQDRQVALLEQPGPAAAPNRSLKWLEVSQRWNSFTNREKKLMWVKLYGHIACNVKQGIYQLEPVKRGQCATCRRVIGQLGLTAIHQETCRPDMYELGCPCGFLCSSLRSLAAHRGSCLPSVETILLGDQAWFPYISPEWRECRLFDKIKLENMQRNSPSD